jgi:beta-lactamase regulating signal transducer with metallopeptidase domain
VFTWLLFNTLCALPLAALALLARASRRVPPAVEHVLWLLVLVRLVLPPIALPAPTPASSGPAVVSSGDPSLGDELVAATTRLLGPSWSIWGAQLLLGLFLATLCFVVVREIRRARAVERCVRLASTADAPLARHVRAVAERLGLAAPPVRVSPEVAGPFLWSPGRPVLVLPEGAELPEETVLAHELAHLARRDHWTAWFELVVQGFHFWNPLFWLARRQLHRAAELACDGFVVARFPGARRAFASALVATAERASGTFVPRAAQAIGADARDFEERLVRILRGGPPGAGRALLAAALVVAGLSLPGLAAPSLSEFRGALPELPAGTDREHWRRSLAAAEARLATAPDDGAAHMQRGVALLGLGRAAESLAAFQEVEALGFQPGKALYNQACAHVRLGDLAEAEACLARAAELGLDVDAYLAVDPDLAPLRER